MDGPRSFVLPHTRIARVAELADALASGASSRKGVEVRVLSWAPFNLNELRCSSEGPLWPLTFAGASSGASWSGRKALDSFTQMWLA